MKDLVLHAKGSLKDKMIKHRSTMLWSSNISQCGLSNDYCEMVEKLTNLKEVGKYRNMIYKFLRWI